MMKTFVPGFTALFVLVLVPMASFADTAAARKEFNAGKNLFAEERYDEAAAAFRRAYDADPSWKLYYNIGQCEAAMKRYGLALEAFERYLAAGGDDIVRDRYDEVMSEIRRLRDMVGTVQIKSLAGAQVTLDGVPMGTLPIPGGVRVAAGTDHELMVSLKGYRPFQQQFFIGSNQTIEIDAELEPESDGATADGEGPPEAAETPSKTDATGQVPPPAQTPPRARSGLTIAGWVLTGTGAAALIAGGILGGAALAKNSELVDACGSNPCPEKKDAVDTRDALAVGSTVALVTGAALAVTGVVLLVAGTKKEKRMSMAPSIGRDGAMARVDWRF